MTDLLLVVNVGNTQIKLGAFRGDALLGTVRLATRRDRTADEYGLLIADLLRHRGIDPAEIAAIALCSVVPPLMVTLEEAFRDQFGLRPFVITPETRTGLRLRYDNPSGIGADRLADAVAAYRLYGGPVITVDLGTATTLNAVTEDGVFLGGAIAPGVGISTEALFARAAKLPRIDLAPPNGSVIGKTTVQSMQVGIVYGYAGGVDALVERFRAEMGAPGATVVATGGFAPLISRASHTIQHVDPDLTLNGCKLVWEMQRADV